MTAAKTPAKRPAAAKDPQDHQQKAAPKPKVEKVDGGKRVTFKGVAVTVPDEALDDFEFLDDLNAVQANKEGQRFPSLLRRLVGQDGYREVMDGLRNEDTGRVSLEEGVEFIGAIFEAISPES